MCLGALLRHTTQQQDGLGQYQLRYRASVGKRCVEYRNTTAGSGLQVDLVGANTETAHGHQLFGSLKYLLCQLGARADTDEVRIGNLLDQLFLAQGMGQVFDIGVTRGVQGINGGLMHAFQQQDPDFALFERRI